MNSIQKNTVIKLEEQEKYIYDLLVKAQRAVLETGYEFPDAEELIKQLENEEAFYQDELNKIVIQVHQYIGDTRLTYSERIEHGYKSEDCQYILVQEADEGKQLAEEWQQVIYKSSEKQLISYADPE